MFSLPHPKCYAQPNRRRGCEEESFDAPFYTNGDGLVLMGGMVGGRQSVAGGRGVGSHRTITSHRGRIIASG